MGGVVFVGLVYNANASNPKRAETNKAVKVLSQNWKDKAQEIEDACDRVDQRRQEGRNGAKGDYYHSLEWFENEYKADYDYACLTNPEEPTYLVIHHTAIDHDSDPQQLNLVNTIHKRQGYSESCFGTHVAYSFFIGADGTLKQTRCLFERSQHTSNQEIKHDSIGIVLAGNYQHNEINREQAYTLSKLVSALKKQIKFEEIQGHCNNKATACPGENLYKFLRVNYDIPECAGHAHAEHHEEEHEEQTKETDPLPDTTNPEMIKASRWYSDSPVVSKLASYDMVISRYYTPVRGQPKYYRNTYEEDFYVNCQGDCLVTASGKRLDNSLAGKALACPKNYPFGTQIYIEDWGIATCWDVGGAIVHGRLDLWVGSNTSGLNNVKNPNFPHGKTRVTVVSLP